MMLHVTLSRMPGWPSANHIQQPRTITSRPQHPTRKKHAPLTLLDPKVTHQQRAMVKVSFHSIGLHQAMAGQARSFIVCMVAHAMPMHVHCMLSWQLSAEINQGLAKLSAHQAAT